MVDELEGWEIESIISANWAAPSVGHGANGKFRRYKGPVLLATRFRSVAHSLSALSFRVGPKTSHVAGSACMVIEPWQGHTMQLHRGRAGSICIRLDMHRRSQQPIYLQYIDTCVHSTHYESTSFKFTSPDPRARGCGSIGPGFHPICR